MIVTKCKKNEVNTMKPGNVLVLSTSPPEQTEGKPPGMIALKCRRRLPCRGIRYRPTGKELDTETGLYYFGARYLDPKTGRWISGDPAVGSYIPQPRRGANGLPGMGGVYNTINLHTYHYAFNNPINYVDPDGRTADGIRDLVFRPMTDVHESRDLRFRPMTDIHEPGDLRYRPPLAIDGKDFALMMASSNNIYTIPVDEEIKNVLKKIWAFIPWTLVGIAIGSTLYVIGKLMGKNSYVKVENNAITFTTGIKIPLIGGSITLGNAIIHANGTISDWNSNTPVDRYDMSGKVSLGRHEEAHTYQYEKYGVFTPFLIIGSAMLNGGFGALFRGGGFFGFMGKSRFEVEADDY